MKAGRAHTCECWARAGRMTAAAKINGRVYTSEIAGGFFFFVISPRLIQVRCSAERFSKENRARTLKLMTSASIGSGSRGLSLSLSRVYICYCLCVYI